MTQAENNKKAMDAIFALEDSRELFEAIGGLNDDQTIGADDGNQEYGVDDMLTVVPGSTDPFAGQSITTQKEPTDEEKRFVIDEFGAQMAKAHKTIVDKEAIDSLSPIIQDKVSMDVNSFLTDVMNAANQRLGSQNVSEAQPGGANPEEPVAAADEQQAAEVPAPDTFGAQTLEPAPGGIAPEPSLDTNIGDGLDTAPADDLGLGAIDGDAGLDDFGAEPAPADDLGLDAIGDDAGLGDEPATEEPAAEEPAGDDLGLDGITDDAGEEAAADDGEPAAEEPAADDAGEGDVLEDSNLDSISDDDFGGDEGADDEETDAEFEAEMANNQAILESIHNKYIEDTARSNVRSLVESFVRNQKTLKKAQFEAAEAKKADEAKFEARAEEMRNELGDKVAAVMESENNAKAEAILENAGKAYAKATARKEKADTEARSRLKATLESISTNYHKVVEKERATKVEAEKAQLESAKVEEAQPVLESAAPAKKTLAEQLDDIVAKVK